MATQQTFEFLAPPVIPAATPPPSFRTRLTEPPGKALTAALHAAQAARVAASNDVADQHAEEPSEPSPVRPADRVSVLADLRKRVGCISTAMEEDTSALDIHSTGCPAIDAMLPRGGLPGAAVTEWIGEHESSGAAAISLTTIAARMNDVDVRGSLVIVSDANHFYPPAAEALGIDLNRIIWARPQTHADIVWSIDQSLRCPDVAMVWARIGGGLDDRDARRLQLAAEEGHTPAMLIRPRSVRGRPTFADVRLHVAASQPTGSLPSGSLPSGSLPSSSLFVSRVTLDRCRGVAGGNFVDVTINDHGQLQSVEIPTPTIPHDSFSTSSVHLASELAHPKASPTTSRTSRRA